MKIPFWHWPDRTIGKRESRRLREEHNALGNHAAELAEVVKASVGAWDAWRNDPREYDDSPEPEYIAKGRALIANDEDIQP